MASNVDAAAVIALRVLIAHGHSDARDALFKTVNALHKETVRLCQSGRELIEAAITQPPDLIITGVDLPDIDGPTALVEISQTVRIPAIVVTQQRSLELVQKALEDHVMAYLIEPIRQDEILPTIYLVLKRFEQFQQLEQENETLKQALSDRKLIERAKGVLMTRAGIDEETAYKRLRRMATDNRIRMSEAADRILSVNNVFDTEPKDD